MSFGEIYARFDEVYAGFWGSYAHFGESYAHFDKSYAHFGESYAHFGEYCAHFDEAYAHFDKSYAHGNKKGEAILKLLHLFLLFSARLGQFLHSVTSCLLTKVDSKQYQPLSFSLLVIHLMLFVLGQR